MTDEITPEIFEHMVKLAALELDQTEAGYLRHELNAQLRAIHELEAIPLDTGTPITSHGVPYMPENTPPIRADEWVPYTEPEAILSQAPENEEGYIVVPEIKHTELE
jgi:aspartyl-tRNA(Asn)/glutamyl-tRNA(Gln) amidotransferase subunit C